MFSQAITLITSTKTRLSENLGRVIEASLLGKETPEIALERSQQRLELIFGDEIKTN
ncbi:MAG: hypothetical protein ACRC2S_26485 [Waterburya sp.]